MNSCQLSRGENILESATAIQNRKLIVDIRNQVNRFWSCENSVLLPVREEIGEEG